MMLELDRRSLIQAESFGLGALASARSAYRHAPHVGRYRRSPPHGL